MSALVTHDHLRVLFLYVTLRLGTLDATSVVEWLTPETNISHQVYRRVWPTTQREALFWSTIQHHPSDDDEGPDYWIVVNHSTEHEHVPVRSTQGLNGVAWPEHRRQSPDYGNFERMLGPFNGDDSSKLNITGHTTSGAIVES